SRRPILNPASAGFFVFCAFRHPPFAINARNNSLPHGMISPLTY
ncbi:hypothetical protein ECPA49_5302, partial [Escherichia coli PA49]